MMLNSGFRKLAAGVAMAVGLGIGSAQAAISTDGVTSDPTSVGNGSGTGSGELFFSIFDATNNNSLTLDLNVGVQAFLADPLAGVSVQNDALQSFIANGDQSAMVWNVAGLNNDVSGGATGLFVLTTVNPSATPSPFGDTFALITAMSNAADYVGAVNGIIVDDAATASAGAAFFNDGAWGSNFGTPLPFSNIASLGDMETAIMVMIGANSGGTAAELVENAQLAQGFWSVDAATGTVGFAPVPVPAAVWLFGSAIIGLIGIRRRA